MLKIFISSTWLDLQLERKAVEQALQRLREVKFSGMEYFGSRDETPAQVSLAEVDRAQLYIGIFGGRYGSGITEQEYRRARARGLPCLIYVKDEAKISPKKRETDPDKGAKLASLKQDLRAAHTLTTFTNPDDLASKVVADLHRCLSEQNQESSADSATPGAIHIRGDGNVIGNSNTVRVTKKRS